MPWLFWQMNRDLAKRWCPLCNRNDATICPLPCPYQPIRGNYESVYGWPCFDGNKRTGGLQQTEAFAKLAKTEAAFINRSGKTALPSFCIEWVVDDVKVPH